MTLKWHWNDIKMTLEWHENDTKMALIYKVLISRDFNRASRSDSEMTVKWQWNDSEMTLKWHMKMFHLIPQQQILLINLLHGKSLTAMSMADQVDGPVGAVGNQLDQLVVVFVGRRGRLFDRRRWFDGRLLLQLADVVFQLGQRVPIEAQLGHDVLREVRHPLRDAHLLNN